MATLGWRSEPDAGPVTPLPCRGVAPLRGSVWTTVASTPPLLSLPVGPRVVGAPPHGCRGVQGYDPTPTPGLDSDQRRAAQGSHLSGQRYLQGDQVARAGLEGWGLQEMLL